MEVQQEPVHTSMAEEKQGQFGRRKLKTWKTCCSSVDESSVFRLWAGSWCSYGTCQWCRWPGQPQDSGCGRWGARWHRGSHLRVWVRAHNPGLSRDALAVLWLCCPRSGEPTHPPWCRPAALRVSNRIAFPFLLFVFTSQTRDWALLWRGYAAPLDSPLAMAPEGLLLRVASGISVCAGPYLRRKSTKPRDLRPTWVHWQRRGFRHQSPSDVFNLVLPKPSSKN